MLHPFYHNHDDVPGHSDIANATSLDANENGIPDECEEETLTGGGGQGMMGGEGGGEFDAETAWEAYFEWYEAQVFGDPGDWQTLNGPQRFERVMNQIELLGLPYARPW